MRREGRIVVLGVMCALSCGGDGPSPVEIDAIEPARGSITGGTRVAISGSGFANSGAPPNVVLFGDTVALNVVTIDDRTLEVTTPAGVVPGSVPVTVANDNGKATAEVFTYNEGPQITTITPAQGEYTGGTEVTIEGSGFEDFGAGTTFVLFDDTPGSEISVISDSQLTIIAPSGYPLDRVDVSLKNTNGIATKEGGFRFVGDGLLALTRPLPGSPDSTLFFIDAVSGDSFPLGAIDLASSGIGGLATADDGTIYGVTNQASFGNSGGGRHLFNLDIDALSASIIGDTGQIANIQDIAFFNGELYAVCKNCGATTQLGTLDLATGSYSGITESFNLPRPRLAATTDTVYLSTYSPNELHTLNVGSGAAALVGAYTAMQRARSFAAIGDTLYVAVAIGTSDGGPSGAVYYNTSIGILDTETLKAIPIGGIAGAVEAITRAPRIDP